MTTLMPRNPERLCLICRQPIERPTRNQKAHTMGPCANVMARREADRAIERRRRRKKG
jgi:hypothetical protein